MDSRMMEGLLRADPKARGVLRGLYLEYGVDAVDAARSELSEGFTVVAPVSLKEYARQVVRKIEGR